jgi:hypothetical protein
VSRCELYTECLYAYCHVLDVLMLILAMLSAIKLNIIKLILTMLSVIIRRAFMLSFTMLIVINAEYRYAQCDYAQYLGLLQPNFNFDHNFLVILCNHIFLYFFQFLLFFVIFHNDLDFL